MEANKKLSPIVRALFFSGRQLNMPLVCISQFYLKVLKTIKLNMTHCFIIYLTEENSNK